MRNFFLRHKFFLSLVVVYQIVFFLFSGNYRFSGIAAALAKEKQIETASSTRIAIIDFGGRVSEESVRKNIIVTFRNTMGNIPRIKTVPESAINSFMAEEQTTDRQKRLEDIKKALKLLRDGKSAYEGMRLDEAAERLSLAKKEFVSNLNELSTNDSLLDAYLYLGMTYFAQEKLDEAYTEFRKVIYLDNKKHLSPTDYSPDVVKTFEKARQDVDSLPRGTLMLDSTPSNCASFINGKSYGLTPINVTLPVGEYFVKVEKDGYVPWYQLISVEDKVNTVEVELPPVAADEELIMALRPVTDPRNMEPGAVDLLLTIGKKLTADIVVLGWIDRDVRDILSAQLFDLRTKKLSYVVQSNLGKNFSNIDNGIQKLVNDLESFIDPKSYVIAMDEVKDDKIPLVAPPQKPSKEFLAAQKKKEWSNKWWVWVLIGGVAAGAAVGIAAGLSSSGGGKITVDNHGNF